MVLSRHLLTGEGAWRDLQCRLRKWPSFLSVCGARCWAHESFHKAAPIAIQGSSMFDNEGMFPQRAPWARRSSGFWGAIGGRDRDQRPSDPASSIVPLAVARVARVGSGDSSQRQACASVSTFKAKASP